MPGGSASLLSTALGLAAALAALSLFVEVVQELYKFLTSSRARCYEQVLRDALGPWIGQVKRQASALELTVRGPFQFLRRRPTGVVLPLDPEDLTNALERTAPDSQRRALEAIRREVRRQEDGGPEPPSGAWTEFLEQLAVAAGAPVRWLAGPESTEPGEPAPPVRAEPVESRDWAAREVLAFLEERDLAPGARGGAGAERAAPFDARALERDFRERFLPHVERVRELHPRIMQNLEYAYRRRNRRQTFLFGLGVALLANVPLGRLYDDAASLPPSETAALAGQVMTRYEALGCAGPDPAEGCPPAESLEAARERLAAMVDDLERGRGGPPYMIDLGGVLEGGVRGVLGYLVGCVLTAILITFGAPFWHDLVGALSAASSQRRPPDGRSPTEREEGD